MAKISDENLDALIKSLQWYKEQGIIDPWIFEDKSTLEPLDALLELKELRNAKSTLPNRKV